jgi:hypothetical protein
MGTRLQSATAKRLPNQKQGRRRVDTRDEPAALARLTTRARANDWTVLESGASRG